MHIVSYNSVQVFQQVVGDNTQVLDLGDQACHLVTWVTADFEGHIFNFFTTHTCNGITSV